MAYGVFEKDKVIYDKDGTKVILGKDKTCIKRASSPKRISKLAREVKCLEKLDGKIAPKLIEHNNVKNTIRMEYIDGYTLPEYVNKYGQIPKFYYSKLVANLIRLVNMGVEYGGDEKFEHFIIDVNNKDIRIIDFGESNILCDESVKKIWEEMYRRTYGFVFKDSADSEIGKSSKAAIRNEMKSLGIEEGIIDKYFADYDKITFSEIVEKSRKKPRAWSGSSKLLDNAG